MARSRRPARSRKTSRDARPLDPATGRRIDRRVGSPDRRATPRGPDRRVGAATAVRMAKARLDGDIEYVKRHLAEGNFWEVAKVALGIAGEVGSVVYSGVLWPLALVGRDLPATLPPEGDAKGASADEARPVVLLHGWFHNRTGMSLMAKRFRHAGRRHVFAIDLPTATASVQRLSEILEEKVDKICELTGAQRVDLVAHSLGGLVARWWMVHGSGSRRLKSLVTLGAPHKGTALAAFFPIGTAKAINIGSDVVRALDVPPPDGVRVTAIWSDMDYLVLPPDLDRARREKNGDVRVRHVGHLSLLYSKSVFKLIEKALSSEARR